MQKLSRKELILKKRQAVHLFIVKGYQQNEIAKMLCLSEKTISKWSVQYKWRDKITKDINLEGGVSALMKRFFEYTQSVKPDAVDSFKTLWNAFLRSEEKWLSNI